MMPLPEIVFYKEAVMWIVSAEEFFENVPQLKAQAKKLGVIAGVIFDYIEKMEEKEPLPEEEKWRTRCPLCKKPCKITEHGILNWDCECTHVHYPPPPKKGNL